MKPIVVQKYGGSSVADVDKIRKVAERIIATCKQGYNVVAVVSAMGGATDKLMTQAREVARSPKKRELDMLLTVGERITMSLLSMALDDMGENAISFTGSQCGIITSDSHSNARIIDVRPVRIMDELERDNIVIVAGFQGMSYKRDITTLGRGGSDTTAVAIAAALGARYCEICSDVDGVYTADPRIQPDAWRIDELSYDEMEVLGEAGAKVLNPDAIEFARQRGLRVLLTASFKEGGGTLVLEKTGESREGEARSVAHRRKAYYIKAFGLSEDELTKLLRILETEQIPTDSVVVHRDQTLSIELLTNPERVPNWRRLSESIRTLLGEKAEIRDDVGSVSLVGAGISNNPENLSQAIAALGQAGVHWWMVDMIRNRISFAVDAGGVEAGVRALHDRFLPSGDKGE
jgi:aspartate kinase